MNAVSGTDDIESIRFGIITIMPLLWIAMPNKGGEETISSLYGSEIDNKLIVDKLAG